MRGGFPGGGRKLEKGRTGNIESSEKGFKRGEGRSFSKTLWGGKKVWVIGKGEPEQKDEKETRSVGFLKEEGTGGKGKEVNPNPKRNTI